MLGISAKGNFRRDLERNATRHGLVAPEPVIDDPESKTALWLKWDVDQYKWLRDDSPETLQMNCIVGQHDILADLITGREVGLLLGFSEKTTRNKKGRQQRLSDLVMQTMRRHKDFPRPFYTVEQPRKIRLWSKKQILQWKNRKLIKYQTEAFIPQLLNEKDEAGEFNRGYLKLIVEGADDSKKDEYCRNNGRTDISQVREKFLVWLQKPRITTPVLDDDKDRSETQAQALLNQKIKDSEMDSKLDFFDHDRLLRGLGVAAVADPDNNFAPPVSPDEAMEVALVMRCIGCANEYFKHFYDPVRLLKMYVQYCSKNNINPLINCKLPPPDNQLHLF